MCFQAYPDLFVKAAMTSITCQSIPAQIECTKVEIAPFRW